MAAFSSEQDGVRDVAASVEQALVDAARALTSHLDLDGVCAAILDAVEQVFGATACWIVLHDEATDTLRTRMFRGPGAAAYRDLALPPDAGVLGLAFLKRKVVFVPDVQEEDRWFDVARVQQSGLRSVFMVPLIYKDRAIGVVGADAPQFGADHPPQDVDVGRLEALAAQAAIAISNAQLYEASEEDRRRLRALVQERRRLRNHVTQLRDEVRAAHSFGEIVGESSSLADVLRQAELVAPADTTVLVLGETGTGKELLARLIHEKSGRSAQPFVPVNCAALPESLVESELFGYEKGAFTGAVAPKPGKFEIAHRGTLFLDEIGDLPLDAQAKLLRVLQDRQVQRVGSTKSVGVDVRLIAATNHDLEAAVADKRFRSDLYYRISVFPLRIPPLRERREDIPLLVGHYVRHFARALGRRVTSVEQPAMDRLSAYAWPGNVRELQNVIERAVILTTGATVETRALDLHAHADAATATAATSLARVPPDGATSAAPMSLADAERQAIVAALAAANGKISGSGGAAERLGVKPTTLHAKMKRLNVSRTAK